MARTAWRSWRLCTGSTPRTRTPTACAGRQTRRFFSRCSRPSACRSSTPRTRPLCYASTRSVHSAVNSNLWWSTAWVVGSRSRRPCRTAPSLVRCGSPSNSRTGRPADASWPRQSRDSRPTKGLGVTALPGCSSTSTPLRCGRSPRGTTASPWRAQAPPSQRWSLQLPTAPMALGNGGPSCPSTHCERSRIRGSARIRTWPALATGSPPSGAAWLVPCRCTRRSPVPRSIRVPISP